MSKIQNVLLTGKALTTNTGRNDERVNISLSTPGREASPTHEFLSVQSHPTAEQLFAGAWSACYIAAIGLAGRQRKIFVPENLSVEIEVDLGVSGEAYLIQARFTVKLPGLPQEVAEALAHAADEICPYSKATRGNIDVVRNVIGA